MKSPAHNSVASVILSIAILVVVVFLLLTPASQGLLRDFFISPFKDYYPEEVTFSLERTMTVDANGCRGVNFAIDIPEPMNITQNGNQMQIVTSVNYSNDLSPTIKYNHNWMVWEEGPFSEDQRRTMTVTYEVTARAYIWDIDASTSGNLFDVPDELEKQYLKDEWMMSMSDPAIVAQAREIVGDEENVYVILRNIYDWMRANIYYSAADDAADPSSAYDTLKARAGDCDDQSILFCSLARAVGVPAWLQLGAMYLGDGGNWGGHGWLQAYVPLKEGGGEKVVIDIVNGDFLVWRPNRFADFTDDGNADHLIDYYSIYNCSYVPPFGFKESHPLFQDAYRSISYEASDQMIDNGWLFKMGVRPPGMCLAPSRI